jgi:hypothetical protein
VHSLECCLSVCLSTCPSGPPLAHAPRLLRARPAADGSACTRWQNLDRTLSSLGASSAALTVDSCLADIEDLLSYCNDILCTGVPEINRHLLDRLWTSFLGPVIFWPLAATGGERASQMARLSFCACPPVRLCVCCGFAEMGPGPPSHGGLSVCCGFAEMGRAPSGALARLSALSGSARVALSG